MKKFIKSFQTYINENNSFDIFEHIDKEEILQYANNVKHNGWDMDDEEENPDYTKHDLINVVHEFNYLNNPIDIYRTVNADDINSVNIGEKIGECWSFLEESALNFASNNLHYKNLFLISGKIYKKDVDWNTTIELFFQNSFSYVDQYYGSFEINNEAENEIRISSSNHNKIFDVKVKKLK